jgi:hypothetical protein
VARRLIEHGGDGRTVRRNGLGEPITKGLLYRLTGDPRVASLMTFEPPRGQAYLPGFGPPSLSRTMMNLPYAMAVLAEFGAGGEQFTDPKAAEAFWRPHLEKWNARPSEPAAP